LAVVRRAVQELGAKVVAERAGRKHDSIQIETSDGITFWMRVSQGNGVDPMKQKGWVRQAINNAATRQQQRR
jgi:hypothetical protein